MSNGIKTNIVDQNEEIIYPITKSELVITESGIPLEESIASKAQLGMSVRFDGINEEGFASLSYFDPNLQAWRNVGSVAAADIEDCGWEENAPVVFQAIQDIQRNINNLSPREHNHVISDITNMHLITERITMLETNPNRGEQGLPGLDGTNGQDGLTPHIDPVDRTWRIGAQNTGVIAEGRNGLDFTSRWHGQRFITIGSTLSWQDGQFMNGQTIIGYQNFIRQQLDFELYNTIAHENLTLKELIPFARNVNYNQYNLAIIEIGISDYSNNIPIEEFQENLLELINIIRVSNAIIPIMILTPINFINNVINNIGLEVLDYIKTIFKVSNEYAIPVCDLFHNSGITPRTISNFILSPERLNNTGFSRISMNIVGAIHMFNGSSSMSIQEEIDEEDDLDEEIKVSPTVVIPKINGDATQLIQNYLNEGVNHHQILIFPNGEWSVSTLIIPNDTTLIFSNETIINQLPNENQAMFVSNNANNINIVNGKFISNQFGNFNEGNNIVLQNINNSGGSLTITNSTRIEISGQISNTTAPIIIENCNQITFNNVIFDNNSYLISLIRTINCSNIDIDKIFDSRIRGTNMASAMIHASAQCRAIRIGNNIDLDMNTFVTTGYEIQNVIQKGRIETIWTGVLEENDVVVTFIPFTNFDNLAFQLNDNSVIPVDFRNNKFVIKDHVTENGHTFLREATFTTHGSQVIQFDNQNSVVAVWSVTEEVESEDDIIESEMNNIKPTDNENNIDDEEYQSIVPPIADEDMFPPDVNVDTEEEDDIIIDGEPDEEEEEEEWEMPKASSIKIVAITGERIRF